MTRFESISLLKDREFAALAGTSFARSQAYSTILIALALYADPFNTTGFVEGLFGTALIPLAATFEGAITPVKIALFGDVQVLGGAFFTLFGAYSLIGVADSIRLPASMSLFVDDGERYDSVASAMSLRSISWKVGQVLGPVLVGITMDFVSTEAGFYLAAGFITVATGAYAIFARRAYRREAGRSTPEV